MYFRGNSITISIVFLTAFILTFANVVNVVGKDATGLLILTWGHIYIYSDERQIVVGSNNCIYGCRKGDEVNRPDLVCRPSYCKVSDDLGGLSSNAIRTLTDVKGNINSQIYIDVLENNLWSVITRYFADNEYVFRDDNTPVHRGRITENYKQENNINCTARPAQSPDLNVCENSWLRIKRALQNNR